MFKALKREIVTRMNLGIFYDEKILGDTFVEQPVPVYPKWAKQPEPGQEFDTALTKGIHFSEKGAEIVDRIAISALAIFFFVMLAISFL